MTNSRNTIQRQLVLSAVRQLQNHPTADEVYQEVQKNCPTISRATVYRNLKLLAEEGEIRLRNISGWIFLIISAGFSQISVSVL